MIKTSLEEIPCPSVMGVARNIRHIYDKTELGDFRQRFQI